MVSENLCYLVAFSSSRNPSPSRPPLHYRNLNRCCLLTSLAPRKYAGGPGLNLDLLICAVHLIFDAYCPDPFQNLLILIYYYQTGLNVAWIYLKSGQYSKECRFRKLSPQVTHSKRSHLYYCWLLSCKEIFIWILLRWHRHHLTLLL